MYNVQICYSNVQDNKLLLFRIMHSFFSLAPEKQKQKTKARRQRKLGIFSYNIQSWFEISSYIQFHCFLHEIITNNLQNLRFYQLSSKIWMKICFTLKLSLSHRKMYPSFLASNFLLVQTAVKFRNSQIYENFQLWYSLNYSTFFQVFVHIFQKSEEFSEI